MTVDPGYFREQYASSPDPWGLAGRWYETRKYALSLALLPRERYSAAFEPGCSIGVLSTGLAGRCDSLLSCDGVADAVASARARTAGLPGVRIEQRTIPADWPPGDFALIVFSEILYYFDKADLTEVLRRATGALRPDGHLLAVHWRHPAAHHPRTGDEAHQALADHHGLARLCGYRDTDFTAEVFTRADGDLRSVAQAGGIV
ncbi:MAG TPA: SAM-dependent methyltransferase [Trebonia sp.]|jgi:SAM-dependent methyltransferase|nr:SAM-dependent methyltransferase [Trebonia sp.]